MDETTQLLFENLGIALLLGLLVGMQREHADSPIAGLRTFPLITLFGTLAAVLDAQSSARGWILATGFLAVAALAVAAKVHQFRQEASGGDVGLTTVAAMLVMFAAGAYLAFGSRVVAIAVGGGVAVLLQFKPEMHGLVARLGDSDLRAIMQFVLITCIILPVLPDTAFGPSDLEVFNPQETWRMVVLMVGISLGGYLIYKFFGRRAGLILGGILGGAISSTATTISYAKRTRDNVGTTQLAALVIVIASTVVYARVLLEISVVAPRHLWEMALPIVLMMAASVAAAAVAWFFSAAGCQEEEMPPQSNPTQLRSAIVFAVLYAGVRFLLAAAEKYAGGGGTFAVAALSGMTDMDAITLSTARMVQAESEWGIDASTGARLIVVAAMSNLLFKGAMTAAIGHRRLIGPVVLLFAVPFLTGAAVLVWAWLSS